MSKAKRIFMLIISLALIFAVLFSAAFIVHESDHHCTGESCHICKLINVCIAALNVSGLIILLFAIAVFTVNSFIVTVLNIGFISPQNTLISLKVKLSC